ncbi:alcohol dehydrogenase family protein [Paraburkholderia sabiae]|uniref:Alcohol dehydrogenase family protein n=1 Tax=Paraburkholderia sabiae TaxID=273251 RepID=A0ABU9QHN2_9BURK|nr:alcohol dehydrogenase family protein [Paraburkholderia sabiae]WJZ76629.1 alcohol dehydrogenase family protein [Paraburkholderia sabiae]CAD6553105.1 Crotonyl-CoA reductase [Paraburkholderia sabiae]
MLPKTMKAVVLTAHGGLDKLVYRDDVPVPVCQPGEVLLDVTACGLNNTDVWVREGAYGTDDDPQAVSTWRRGRSTLSFPRIQGADIVGRVVAVGSDVSETRIGERVIVDASIYNRDDDSLADIDYVGHGRDGGYAEYAAVSSGSAHRVDSSYSDAELATFWCAYHTGEQMIERAAVKSGDTVLITGASGGVGSAIIQLCRARGAIPYAVVSEGKEEAVLKLGAEGAMLRESPDFAAAVEQMTGGKPIDVVADLVGGALFGKLLNILRPEGRYTTAGAIAGPVVQLDLRTMYLKQLQLNGSSQGTRGAFRRVLDYIQTGTIKPVLAATYPLSKFHEAQTQFMGKRFVGNIVVVPDRHYSEVAVMA